MPKYTVTFDFSLDAWIQNVEVEADDIEEAKEKFEQDIKSGKNIKASDYIKRENDYNNNLSKSGLFISKTIDDVFSNVMAFVFNEINKTVNS